MLNKPQVKENEKNTLKCIRINLLKTGDKHKIFSSLSIIEYSSKQ